MKSVTFPRVVAILVVSSVFLTAGISMAGHHEKKADIVDTAVAAGSFTTLVAAAKAAGLVDTLKGDGPLTVFAPTDEAFAKLPEGTVESLLKDKEKLAAILTYHVVAGDLRSGDVVARTSLETVQGSTLAVATDDGVTIGGAGLVKADVVASNGVIHVIDTVLIPAN